MSKTRSFKRAVIEYVVAFSVIIFLLWLMALPYLNMRHEGSRRFYNMNNMRQHLIGVHLYTDDHEGRFPADIVTLIEGGYVDPDGTYFASEDDVALPDNFEGMSREEKSVWLAKGSFVFVWPTKKIDEYPSPSEHVLVYRRHTEVEGEVSVIAGFMDGHVGEMSEEEFDVLIKRQGEFEDKVLGGQEGIEK